MGQRKKTDEASPDVDEDDQEEESSAAEQDVEPTTTTSSVDPPQPTTNQSSPRKRRTKADLEVSATAERDLLRIRMCLQCFDAVGWAAGRAFGL